MSGLASTPYNTAVGGTDFNWCLMGTAYGGSSGTSECTAAPYWGPTYQSKGSTMVVTSALGYVPETPWNETCVNPLTLSFQQLIFGTGNAYVGSDDDNHGVGDTEEGCNALLYDANELEEFGGVYAYSLNLLDNVGGSGGASNCVASTTTETTVGACSTGATTTGPTNNPGTKDVYKRQGEEAVTAENDAVAAGVVGDGPAHDETELEAGAQPWNPDERVVELAIKFVHLGEAVAGGGECDAPIGMKVIDMREGQEAVQRRIDGRGDGVVTEGAKGIHRNHVVFVIDSLVERNEGKKFLLVERGKARALDAAEVSA